MDQSFPAKSYGRADASWDKDRVREILEDAYDTARKHGISLCVEQDKSGDIVLAPNSREHKLYIVACGITLEETRDSEHDTSNRKEFWDNVRFASYSIDEMVPRVYGVLVMGVIEYGGLWFLSEGGIQLDFAFDDARKMAKMRDKPFILGYGKDGLAVAPMSERSRFIDPMSCIVARSGTWSVSDIHSSRTSCVDRGTITYHLKSYGPFESDYQSRIRLENAFEDAAKMPKHRDGQACVVLSGDHICVQPEKRSYGWNSIRVDPDEFWHGNILLQDKIREAARTAYERFSSSVRKYQN